MLFIAALDINASQEVRSITCHVWSHSVTCHPYTSELASP